MDATLQGGGNSKLNKNARRVTGLDFFSLSLSWEGGGRVWREETDIGNRS